MNVMKEIKRTNPETGQDVVIKLEFAKISSLTLRKKNRSSVEIQYWESEEDYLKGLLPVHTDSEKLLDEEVEKAQSTVFPIIEDMLK